MISEWAKFTSAAALLFISLSLLSLSGSQAGSSDSCPVIANGETAEDCPWAGVARSMAIEAEMGGSIMPILAHSVPELYEQILSDRAEKTFKALWGESINIDAGSQATIVHPAILDSLAEVLDVQPRRGHIVHAGMEQLYGYLFSNLRTPDGFKRARWVRGDIEAGFGLPRGVLGPRPSEGSLFANVTYFLSRIAFRDHAALSALLIAEGSHIEQFLRDFAFESLRPRRLSETVELASESGKRRTVTLRTDFVPFTRRIEGRAHTHLLIYSVQDSLKFHPELIAAFPVGSAFVDQILDARNLGPNQPIKTHYNAYVDGVTDAARSLQGTRAVH